MACTLYWFPGSPPSRAAALTAKILDIGVEVIRKNINYKRLEDN